MTEATDDPDPFLSRCPSLAGVELVDLLWEWPLSLPGVCPWELLLGVSFPLLCARLLCFDFSLDDLSGVLYLESDMLLCADLSGVFIRGSLVVVLSDCLVGDG